jgi:hypothetical protein
MLLRWPGGQALGKPRRLPAIAILNKAIQISS